ncbi:GTP pyrophosphokinase family protein [Paenibacillus amylolyticus]|uniref:GTP pyrophosphokinase n=1 Tax=Paenibacillus amylolyticus TaxID=1451 RepID=UPI000FD8AB9A|nr:hypothetical protein [Paenibacillus amylolyticus]
MSNKNIDDLRSWYSEKHAIYSNLASKVESIIREQLEFEGVTYYSISSRAKDIESFIKKASKEKYSDPITQIQDLAGIRVITFVRSEVLQCSEIIRPLFQIDEQNSIDKGRELGDDKVGYRSLHYVAKLSDERIKLPEFRGYQDLNFEIQIRTILEHAWADISHDRSYKFQGDFPPEYDIKRRFALASATLELVDREFDAIVSTLNQYEAVIDERTSKGEIDNPINITTLYTYLNNKLEAHIKDKMIESTFNGGELAIIRELNDFGLKSIYDLDKLIHDAPLVLMTDNFTGYLRNVMMYTDMQRYFSEAWNAHWSGLERSEVKMWDKLGRNIHKYIDLYDISISIDV